MGPEPPPAVAATPCPGWDPSLPTGKSAPLPPARCPLGQGRCPSRDSSPGLCMMRFGQSLCVLMPSLRLSQHPLHWAAGEFRFLGSCALLEPGTLLPQTPILLLHSTLCFSVPSFHLLFQGDPGPASQLSLLLWKLLSQMKTSQHGSGVKPRHLHLPLAAGGFGSPG